MRIAAIILAIAVVAGGAAGFSAVRARMDPASPREASSAEAQVSDRAEEADGTKGGSFLQKLFAKNKKDSEKDAEKDPREEIEEDNREDSREPAGEPDGKPAGQPDGGSGPQPVISYDGSKLEIPWGARISPGMDVRVLFFSPDWHTAPSINGYHLWDGRLVAEIGGSEPTPDGRSIMRTYSLASYDLETGEELFTFPIELGDINRDTYATEPYTLRQVYETPGNFCVITPREYREYTRDGELVSAIPAPDMARYWEGGATQEDPYPTIFGPNWDLRPELDLMVWADPDGVWAADAKGENSRLLIATEDFSQWDIMKEDLDLDIEELGSWSTTIPRAPRIMDGGRTVSIDIGPPWPTVQRVGHLVISLKEGWKKWQDISPSGVYYYIDRLYDTDIIIGPLHIDAATGEVIATHESGSDNGFWAITGDYRRHFGYLTLNDEYNLVTFTEDDREHMRHIATLPWVDRPDDPVNYRSLGVVAATSNQALYSYSQGEGRGLLLVTVPEK